MKTFAALCFLFIFAISGAEAGPDKYEPDDRWQDAAPLLVNIQEPNLPYEWHQRHNFYNTGGADWVKFYCTKDQLYTITVQDVSLKCDVVIRIYDRDRTLIKETDYERLGGEEDLLFKCEFTGVYYAKISQCETSAEGCNAEYGDETEYTLMLTEAVAGNWVTLHGWVNPVGIGEDCLITTTGRRGTFKARNGYYSIEHPPGSFTLMAEAEDFEIYEQPVSIKEMDGAKFDINLTPEHEADEDGDGITDAWEKKYGLDPSLNDASEDQDHDGLSNYEEFLMDSDPTRAEGYKVDSELWIRAKIRTVEKGAVDAVWKKGGEGETAGGHRVIWGYFYASPSDVNWGDENNPDLFVKIWFDASGRVDVNFFHVSVPDIEVYSDYPFDRFEVQQGTTTVEQRYIRQHYMNGEGDSEVKTEDGNPPEEYALPTGNPTGYDSINHLRIGAMINTDEKGLIEAKWRSGGEGTTAGGHQVAWGHFHADPSDVDWGNRENPDMFVKIWFDISGRTDVNFFHVSVPDIEVFSDLPDDGTYSQKGTAILENRYIRQVYQHIYDKLIHYERVSLIRGAKIRLEQWLRAKDY